MNIRLKKGIDPGMSHQRRLEIARKIVEICRDKYGAQIAAIGVYGSTAVDKDLPYSDLDMTILTRTDLGGETRCFEYEGIPVQLDFQTIEESLEAEARIPGQGGCWTTFLPLYDPDGEVERLRRVYQSLTADDINIELAKRMRDHLLTYVGKARNAVLLDDRGHLIKSATEFGEECCRALEMLNGAYTTGQASLREAAKTLPQLLAGFAELIDTVSGATPATEQAIYDAVEELWEGMRQIARERGIDWRGTDLHL
ncbi:MAG: hypothetical protein GKR89_31475 [Candidatus Latescibacteria bacterium]|nr:hypothetical protein [Candidatus Latescibacterota bacterium]